MEEIILDDYDVHTHSRRSGGGRGSGQNGHGGNAYDEDAVF